MTSFRDEIREQPRAAERLLREGGDEVAAVAAAIRARGPRFGVIAARGTSDHAAIYAQYLFGDVWRLPVALATPSLHSLYGAVPRYGDGLVMGISQSGRSPDIVGVVAEARSQGAITVAVTNDAASPLAVAAEHVVELRAGREQAVAATKTYTTELLAVAMLARAGADRADGHTGLDALDRVPDVLAEALTLEPEAEGAALSRAGLDRCVVIGRGYDYPTGREWALKLQELAHVLAHPYSSADFQHGPIALADAGLTVLAVAATSAPRDEIADLLERLRGLGCRIVAIAPTGTWDGVGHDPAITALRVPGGLPDRLAPLVAIVPAQLFTYHLARAGGHDPDAPRGIEKVTLTS